MNKISKLSINKLSEIVSEQEAKKIYNSYIYNRLNNYPYVTGKIACSKDNFSAHKSKIITNKHSQNVSHLLRYKNQGILIKHLITEQIQ